MIRMDFSRWQGKRVCSIINPLAAGRKWQKRRSLQRFLKENLPGKVIDARQDKIFTITTVKKMCQDHDLIIAAGGDGTIADVIQGIFEAGREKEVILGIIPLGSGNAFRKSLGIPKHPLRSMRALSKGEVKEIDLIDIEGVPAAFASIGATARITLEKLHDGRPGLAGHLLASRIMSRLPRLKLEVELYDGKEDSGAFFEKETLSLEAFDVVVSKTNYFGYSWRISPLAAVDDGYIDITFFEVSGMSYLLNFLRIYFGTFQRTQKHFKAKRAVFRGKDLPIQYHGEILGIKDLIGVKVLPRALKVIVPAKTHQN